MSAVSSERMLLEFLPDTSMGRVVAYRTKKKSPPSLIRVATTPSLRIARVDPARILSRRREQQLLERINWERPFSAPSCPSISTGSRSRPSRHRSLSLSLSTNRSGSRRPLAHPRCASRLLRDGCRLPPRGQCCRTFCTTIPRAEHPFLAMAGRLPTPPPAPLCLS
jgi:hypothetical protein